jgi:predicted nucleic acid-binding protein
MKKVFIDSTGWYALVQSADVNHNIAKDYFQSLLDSGAKLYTNIIEIDNVINLLKKNCGLNVALEFSKLIEEAVLSTNLHISWVTRRLRRNSLKQFFSIKEPDIQIRHCMVFEEVRRKKIISIFSFDQTLKSFGIPLMPQV